MGFATWFPTHDGVTLLLIARYARKPPKRYRLWCSRRAFSCGMAHYLPLLRALPAAEAMAQLRLPRFAEEVSAEYRYSWIEGSILELAPCCAVLACRVPHLSWYSMKRRTDRLEGRFQWCWPLVTRTCPGSRLCGAWPRHKDDRRFTPTSYNGGWKHQNDGIHHTFHDWADRWARHFLDLFSSVGRRVYVRALWSGISGSCVWSACFAFVAMGNSSDSHCVRVRGIQRASWFLTRQPFRSHSGHQEWRESRHRSPARVVPLGRARTQSRAIPAAPNWLNLQIPS